MWIKTTNTAATEGDVSDDLARELIRQGLAVPTTPPKPTSKRQSATPKRQSAARKRQSAARKEGQHG